MAQSNILREDKPDELTEGSILTVHVLTIEFQDFYSLNMCVYVLQDSVSRKGRIPVYSRVGFIDAYKCFWWRMSHTLPTAHVHTLPMGRSNAKVLEPQNNGK